MIYFIMMAQLDKEGNPVRALKFGYSGSWETRLTTYRSYFANLAILGTYEEGTIEDEDKLVEYFRDKVLFGREWLVYDEDIVDFFKTNNTINKLREALKLVMPKRTIRANCINPYLIDYIMNNLGVVDLMERINKHAEIVRNLRFYPSNKHIEVACNLYSLDKDSVLKYIEERVIKSQEINTKIIELSKKINDLKSVTGKLKLLIEFSESEGVDEKDINNLLELLPGKYKDYYTLLGPGKIKCCHYKESEIKKAWRTIITDGKVREDVIDEMYKLFNIGNKYSNVEIKDSLNSLYKKLNYSKKAKTTDLELIYILKPIKLQDGSGKWVNGQEILGKR